MSQRQDGVGGRWVNEQTGRGGPMDRHAFTDFVPPMPLGSTQIDGLLEFDGLARRVVWREAEDALRPGFTLAWHGLAPAREVEINRWLRRRYNIYGVLAQARAYARGTGGAGIVVVADDGGAQHEPLQLGQIRAVPRLVVKDRFELWPDPQIDLDPLSPTYGGASHYYIQSPGRTFRIHASRVIRMDGLPISDRSRQLRNGWGGSVLDLVYAQLRNWGSSHEDAAEAITLLTQGTFRVKGLADAVSRGNRDFLERRYEALRLGLGTLGDLVLDDSESYEIQSRSFAGLGELLDLATRAVVVVSDMPEVVLIGSRSAGLNGGSQGDDLRGWYDFLGHKREEIHGQPGCDLIEILLAQPHSPVGGVVPVDLGLEWPDMWAPTVFEAAELRSKASQARATDLSAAVITRDEARSDQDLAEHYELEKPKIEEPTADQPALAAAATATEVAKQAMNGAQIEAVKSILADVSAKLLPPDAGAWLMRLAVPDLTEGEVQRPIAAAANWTLPESGATKTDEIKIEDESAIPPGEAPVSAIEAARRLGYGSSAPIMRLINDGKIRVWRATPTSPYRVLISEIAREMYQAPDLVRGLEGPTPSG